jgi:Flp pilus assembly protein TadG
MEFVKKLFRDESGQAIVETAFVAPILVLLLVGLVDYGRFMHDGILIANAARAGAQYASQNVRTANDISGIQNAVLADMQNSNEQLLTQTDISASTYYKCTDGATVVTPSSTLPNGLPVCSSSPVNQHTLMFIKVVVQPTIPFSLWIPYPGLSTVTITKSAEMQISP